MGTGSKIDQLYSDGRGSKLDQLYSDGGGDAATKASTRERKSNDMIDRNLQRAMRTGSPQQRLAAGRVYQERSQTPGYQQGGGIQSAEVNQNRDRKTADNFTKEGLRLQGKENPADVVAGQADAANKGVGVSTADGGTNSKIGTSKADTSGGVTMEKRNPASGALGNGSGSSAENARGALAEGSAGGGWVNVGPSATSPATTPPMAQGGAVSGKPVISRDLQAKRDAVTALKDQWSFDEESKVDRKDYRATPDQISKEDSAASAETAFNNLIKDRPADQKAMFARLSNEDKAAMVQKNESLKTVREEIAKLGPDKNSNSEQAKALIPGAKKELQGFIDAADIMTGSTRDAFGDFEAKAESLREKRGAAEWRGTMDSVVSGAASIQGQDEPTVTPSGNPLFGDSPDAEALYKQTASNKPTSTKTPETGGPSNARPTGGNDGWMSAIGEDAESVGQFAKNYFKGAVGVGDSASKIAAGYIANTGAFGANAVQNLIPGKTGEKLRESDFGGKIKDGLYDAVRFIPNKILGTIGGNQPSPQASNNAKLQQHHASIDASKGVLQGARKITDDIWGSSYAAV